MEERKNSNKAAIKRYEKMEEEIGFKDPLLDYLEMKIDDSMF